MTEHEEERIEVEIPAVTAPVFPAEIVLHNSANFFQRMVGGGMAVKFCAVAQTPQGFVPIPPGYVVEFDQASWERFKREVASDGERPRVEVHRTLGGGLNGSQP